jgi:phage-related protein
MEWQVVHYRDHSGKDPIDGFLRDLRKGAGPKAPAKILRQINLLADLGFSAPDDLVRKAPGDLWELRATFQRNPYRILFYNPMGRTLVLLHVFHKKEQNIPESDILKAVRRMVDDREQRRRGEIT